MAPVFSGRSPIQVWPLAQLLNFPDRLRRRVFTRIWPCTSDNNFSSLYSYTNSYTPTKCGPSISYFRNELLEYIKFLWKITKQYFPYLLINLVFVISKFTSGQLYIILYTAHGTHYIVDGCLVVAIIKVLITSKNVTTDKITSRTELTD